MALYEVIIQLVKFDILFRNEEAFKADLLERGFIIVPLFEFLLKLIQCGRVWEQNVTFHSIMNICFIIAELKSMKES